MKKNYRFYLAFLFLHLFLFAGWSAYADGDGPAIRAHETISLLTAPADFTPSFSHTPVLNPDNSFRGSVAYGENVWTKQLFSLDMDTPTSPMVIATIYPMSYSGDFTPTDPDYMWMIDGQDNFLKKVDITTGFVVDSVYIPCPIEQGIWTVLSIHKATGVFYAVATDGAQSILYKIDPVSGDIFSLLNLDMQAVISGAFDATGTLYLFDIVSDKIFSVDVANLSINTLGDSGFDGNYAQGMGYDSQNDVVYLAAYNADTDAGPELRSLDRSTGLTTLVAALPGETTAFGFPYVTTPDDFVKAGDDHWTSPCGYLEFGQDGDFPPLPADFFGPGSDPFDGIIALKGANSDGSQFPAADVVVTRLGDVPFSSPYPSTGTIDIQMVELKLKSTEPISISIFGIDSFFDVFVELNYSVVPYGLNTITKEDAYGGVFEKEVSPYLVFTFTDVTNPTYVLTFDTYNEGLPPLDLVSVDPYPWTHSPIENEFDPMSEDPLILRTNAGNDIYLLPYLVRNDNLFLDMGQDGAPVAWQGSGFNDGEWYYYENFNWWNVWFYDHPVDDTRRKVIDGMLMIQPRMPDLPSYVEIVFNWSTPEWPGYPEVNRPPLPGDVTDPAYEQSVIQRSEPLIIYEDNIFEDIPIPIPFEILEYNPEWLSIDLRGYNFILVGDIQHVCFKEGDCPETGLDWGDAPDGAAAPMYRTLSANNGPSHIIVPTIHMGPTIDGEDDGQPDMAAVGDDNVPSPTDEDGVIFLSSMVSGQTATIQVDASVDGFLNAWLDFDMSYSFTGEQIFIDKLLLAGINTLSFDVPASSITGTTFARFRFDTNGGLNYYGPAENGEVEDYMIEIVPEEDKSKMHMVQWPDLTTDGVDNYCMNEVVLADDFLCIETGYITDIHVWGSWFNDYLPEVPPKIVLGLWSDNPSGQYGYSEPRDLLWEYTFETGDYTMEQYAQVEDGEWFYWPQTGGAEFPGDYSVWKLNFYVPEDLAMVQDSGTIYWLSVNVQPEPGYNYNFGWKSSRYHFNDYAVWQIDPPMWNKLCYPEQHPLVDVCQDLAFYISGSPETPQEDFDWGDAPDAAGAVLYPTLSASNGAYHMLDGYTFLGMLIDPEDDGIPDANALGDDLDNLPDESGVMLTSSLISGATATIDIYANGNCMLNAWFDFSHNYSWADAGEHVFINQPLNPGVNNLNIPVPVGTTEGDVYARFRVNQNGGISYDGYGYEGEVEDYKFFINDTIPDTKTGNPQYPDPRGWDVNFTYPATLGDDWICSESGAVEDFHFWVSWLNDIVPDEFENAIEKFDVSIFSDIPASQSPTEYSMPGEELWQRSFAPGEFTYDPVFDHLQGWYDPYTGNADPQNHYGCYRIDIDNFDDPFIQEEGTIYWLVISAHMISGSGGGTQDIIVTLDGVDPGILPYQTWTESDVILSIQDYSGYTISYTIEPDGIALHPALLNCDLTGLPGTVVSAEVDVIPGCGPGCGPTVTLYQSGLLIDQKQNSGSGSLETLIVTNPGGYIPDQLTIGCLEGKVLEIRFVIETGEGYQIGWKTSIDHWNDNATYLENDLAYSWYEMYDPITQENLDLSFVITGNPVPQEDFDWGDAPDAAGAVLYPTLSASNGAYHSLDGYTFMGLLIDAEANGIPSPFALGDDLDNLDDEDGVTLTSSLVTGAAATLDVYANGGCLLNAWFDFNKNFSWADAGEHVFVNVPLNPGVNSLNLTVPAGTLAGDLFARFRVNQNGGIPYDGYGYEGEVEDYKFYVNDTIPDTKTGNPQYPDPNGWDVNFTYPATLGDDWICSESGAVEDFHFWVSWLNDIVPEEFENIIEKFDLSIYSDIPASQSPSGFSMPGDTLWVRSFYTGEFSWTPVFDHLQGWYDPYTGEADPENHYGCYRIDIDNFEDPFIQVEGTIYWLVISAHMISGSGGGTQNIVVTLDGVDPGTLPYQTWTESGVVLSIQDLSGPANYEIDPDGINLWVALLNCDLTGLSGTVISAEVDVEPYCGPGCGADVILYQSGLIIDQKYNVGSGSVETIVVTNPGGYIPDQLTIGCYEGKVLEIRFLIETGEDYQIGWKTSIDHFNDNAVYQIFDYSYDWMEMYDPISQENLDLSFVITGNPAIPQDELDFGDAPDPSFPTLLANDGARHFIDGVTYMGALIDGEPDGIPNATATGDDLDNLPDEDGVTFITPLVLGQPAQVKITTSVTGWLSAWVDFNKNGSWGDPGEQIFTDELLPGGDNIRAFLVPMQAQVGNSFARFRFSNQQTGLSYKGFAENGEVEDYQVEISDNETIKWIQYPDAEFSGYHAHDYPGNELYVADDWQCEGGLVTDLHWWGYYEFPNSGPCKGFRISIYDNDPSGPKPGGQILTWDANFGPNTGDIQEYFTGHYSVTGDSLFYYYFVLPEPFAQIEGNFYWLELMAMSQNISNNVIWKWQTNGDPTILGMPIQRDITGYMSYLDLNMAFVITSAQETREMDFGDAKDPTYPTLLVSNGARHLIDPNIYLGNLIDAETDGLQSVNALGDDLNNLDDEDGVIMNKPFVIDGTGIVKVKASVDGYLNAWFDFNGNGSWADAGEQVFIDAVLTAGLNSLTFAIPDSANPGPTFARFRYNTTGGLSYTGFASDGEVEDYRVMIYPPGWGFNPTGSSHLISVPVGITFNCISLSSGDFIGTYYTDENGNLACGGAAWWDGTNNQVVMAFGDDITTPLIKEGFDEDEEFTWMVYYTATSSDEEVVVGYNTAMPDFDGKFHNNGISALTYVSNQISAAVSYQNTICAGDPVQFTTYVSLNCGPVTYSWTSDPAGFTSNLPNPTDTPLVTTTYYLEVTDGYSIANIQASVTVNPLPVVVCPNDTTVCDNGGPFVLTGATPAGGTYWGFGVSGGVFYPVVTGTGNHIIHYYYTDANGCTNDCDFVITVSAAPVVDCPAWMEACENDLPVLLNNAYPQGGDYNGNGVVFNDPDYYYDPSLAGVGTWVITYCYTDPVTGCSNCCQFDFIVHALPVVDCPDDMTVCIDTPPFTPAGATPAGGTYSGTGVSGGVFDPAAAGVGTHIITYTYEDPQTFCINTCAFTITVVEIIATCPDDFEMCIDDGPLTLTGGLPAGGTYNGTGVSGGVFYPLVAGTGNHTLSYTVVYPGTNCYDICYFVATVHPLPVMDCPAEMGACFDTGLKPLDNCYPLGGDYSGTGVVFDGTNYYFDTSVGVGIYLITYCYTDPTTGCSNCCEFNFVVKALPVVDCGDDMLVCISVAPFNLTQATPTGGAYSGTGVTAGVFDPAAAGAGDHVITYTYTDPQTFCTNTCTFVITVIEVIAVCPEDMAVCIDEAPFVLTGGSPSGGVYTGPGVSGGIFRPVMAGVGTHFIQYCVADPLLPNCVDCCEFAITVYPLPNMDCPADFEACLGAPPLLLTGGYPLGGEYSGTGVTENGGQYFFDPATAGLGNHTIIYCYTDPNTLCTNCCAFVITVVADHVIDFNDGWRGISSYIIPENNDLDHVLHSIMDDLIIFYNLTGTFWPSQFIYTLNKWDEYDGYIMKTSDDGVLPICGNEVTNKTVNLGQGWNIIPVLSSFAVDIETMFTGVDNFVLAKDVAGPGVYWKNYGINTIYNVIPGSAYFVLMSGPGSITYPMQTDNASTTKPVELPVSPWNEVTNTPASHTVVFNVASGQFEPGDIIGGFNADGWYTGIAEAGESGQSFVLALNGDDPYSTEIDGFVSGELLRYKLYRSSTGETFDLDVIYNPEMNTGYFENHGMSEIGSVKMSATGISEQASGKLRIYPNPTHGIFTIEGINANVGVQIFNTFGEEIYMNEMYLPEKLDLTSQPKGVYIIRVENNGEVYYEKLVIE